MDGVMVDVGQSYRQAIILTAEHFGVTVTHNDISAIKSLGNANNDWEVTLRLLSDKSQKVPTLEEVTKVFEDFYQGTPSRPGLWERETILINKKLLDDMSKRFPLAIVTGRPRLDAVRLLEKNDLAKYFKAVVCMEDAAKKPDPAPVRLALEKLGLSSGRKTVMIGDTPDDALAAIGAGVVPIGILAPGERTSKSTKFSLVKSGVAKIIDDLEELRSLCHL